MHDAYLMCRVQSGKHLNDDLNAAAHAQAFLMAKDFAQSDSLQHFHCEKYASVGHYTKVINLNDIGVSEVCQATCFEADTFGQVRTRCVLRADNLEGTRASELFVHHFVHLAHSPFGNWPNDAIALNDCSRLKHHPIGKITSLHALYSTQTRLVDAKQEKKTDLWKQL